MASDSDKDCAQCGGYGHRACPICSGKGCYFCVRGRVVCPDCSGTGKR